MISEVFLIIYLNNLTISVTYNREPRIYANIDLNYRIKCLFNCSSALLVMQFLWGKEFHLAGMAPAGSNLKLVINAIIIGNFPLYR